MITRTSIKCTNVDTGEVKVFRSMNEAAAKIGVTEGAIRYAMKKDGRKCRGWAFEQVPTVCAVRTKDDGNYYLCEVAEGGGGFDVLGEDGGYIPGSDVAEVFDVTENFNGVRNGKKEKPY